MDINKPVENPTLVAAIEEMAQAPGPQAQEKVIAHLQKSFFLLPLAKRLEGVKGENGNFQLQKGATIAFFMPEDKQGNRWLPIFTDWPALRKWSEDKDCETLVVPFSDLPALLLAREDNTAGAMLNPGSHNLPVTRELLARITGKTVAHTVKKDTKVQLMQPSSYPGGIDAIIKQALKPLRQVKKAWLLMMRRENEESFLLVLDCPGDAIPSVANSVMSAAKPLLPQGIPLDMTAADGSLGQTVQRDYAPLFKRGLFG